MAGYLLNLTAKNPTSATSADGLFNANSVDNTSRVWFRVPDTWPGIVFDPNHGAPWPVGVAAPLSSWVRVPNTDDAALPCQVGDKFYIRIAPDSSWPTTNNLHSSFAALFGRPPLGETGRGSIASPFVIPANNGRGNNSPQTWFQGSQNQPTVAADGSSIYLLGQIPTGDTRRQATYSFIVGAYLAYPGVEGWTFGHDPKIVVGGGGGR